jgi:hypothetical protein
MSLDITSKKKTIGEGSHMGKENWYLFGLVIKTKNRRTQAYTHEVVVNN